MARHRELIRKIRRRRSPEMARQELLDAAERLFRDLTPDQVGLKDIGREADVSHALVTHYFGTYVGVVEAVFERRTRALRERILERLAQGGISDAETLIDMLFTAFDDPVHLRLMKWFLANEGANASHALALRDRGLALVAAQVTHAIDPNAPPELKERVELALVTTVSAAFGYAATKLSLASGLGRPVSVELDRGVRRTLAAMLQTYLRSPLI